MDALNELTRYIDRFPTLPEVALGVADKLEAPACDLRKIAELIAMDPVISAQMIRMANSALFGGTAPTDSLLVAINRLGITQTRNAVLTVAVMNTVPVLPPPLSINDFWTLGLGTALSARHIGRGMGYTNPEQAYLAGLVHSLGEAYLAVFFTDRYRQTAETARLKNSSLEAGIIQEFGVSHTDLCAAILRKWNFPESVTEAVQFHLTPELAPCEKVLASILFSADRIWRDLAAGTGSPELPDHSWAEEIPEAFSARIRALGYPDITFFLMEQLEFVNDVREVVRSTFSGLSDRTNR
jgi:HD-like signal output (HDOD) protein